MKLLSICLIILTTFVSSLKTNDYAGNFKKSSLSLLSQKVQTDSSDCLSFDGIGPGCGKTKICPNHILYSSELLRRKINFNLSKNSEKIPPTCCRDYDTLSINKQIFFVQICWGGPYTELWIYSLNENRKFESKEYGFNGIKLDSKTLGVHDFLLYEYHSNEYSLMKYNGNVFDTAKMIHCSEIEDRSYW